MMSRRYTNTSTGRVTTAPPSSACGTTLCSGTRREYRDTRPVRNTTSRCIQVNPIETFYAMVIIVLCNTALNLQFENVRILRIEVV